MPVIMVACGTGQSGLLLEEIDSVLLPSDFNATGMVVSRSDEVILWDRAGDRVLFVGAEGTTANFDRAIVKSPVAAGFLEGEGVAEIVDATSGTVHRFKEVAYQRSWPLQLPVVPEAAGRVGKGWFITGRPNAGILNVYFVREDAGSNRVFSVVLRDSTIAGSQPVVITPLDSTVLLALTDAPFTVWEINEHGAVLRELLPDLPQSKDAEPEHRLWRSLPPLAIDGRFLQMLTDLRSDRRLLVLYDEFGVQIRTTEVAAPLGFGAVDPANPLLLGIRRITDPELVFYEWRWEE